METSKLEEMPIANAGEVRKVSIDDFILLKVLGKGSFGKVAVYFYI